MFDWVSFVGNNSWNFIFTFLDGGKMFDVRNEPEIRYHIRFNSPHDHTVEVSKDYIMAYRRAKQFFEDGVPFSRKVYVVEVKEKLRKSFEG